ncbi:MAG: site-2 protease family protein [Gemmataceae bacterium]
MFRSLKLGKVFGIDLFVHGTFWLLPLFVLFSGVSAGDPLLAIGVDVAFVFTIFVCVALHELGHALAARSYGIGTRDITLYPLGGVASLERMPEKPSREIAIALAGPAVNFVIAGGIFAGFLGMAMISPWSAASHLSLFDQFLVNVMFANLVLGGFNLLPCFPMDGGRVFRALLATRLSRLRATEIAATVGSVVAGGLILAGLLLPHFGLILVAVMVWLLGQAELAGVRMHAGMREARARIEDLFERPREPESPVSRGFTGIVWDEPRRVWVQYADGRVVRVLGHD